jgi:arylsulfatase A-like enzyme
MSDERTRSAWPIILLLLGALAGGIAAVARMALWGEYLAPWGALAWLDLPILVLALGAAGCVLGLVLRLAGRRRGLPRKPILWLAAIGLVICAALFAVLIRAQDPVSSWSTRRDAEPSRPDVLIVLYDAVRADVFYEDDQVPDWAPNLQRLSRSGIVFQDAVAPAPWTLPTHASLFTGLTPLDHGAVDESKHLADQFTTLAEAFQDRGYRTIGLVANPWLTPERGFDQGFDAYVEIWRLREVPLPLYFHITGRLEAHHWMRTEDPRFDKGARIASMLSRRFLRGTPPDQPLFVFVNLIDAHPPYDPPWPYSELDPAPPPDINPYKISQDWVAIITGEAEMDERRMKVLRQLNEGEVAYLDEYLGSLLDTLEETGRFNDAFIAVTADHGAALGEDRLLGSGFDLREEMLRIPLVIRYPGGAGGPATRTDTVWLQDLYTTTLALADDSPDLEGPPLGDRMVGAPLTRRSDGAGVAAYSRPLDMLRQLAERAPEFDASFMDRRMVALRGNRWKFVWSSRDPQQLFDLEASGESENLCPAMPRETADWELRMEQVLGATPADRWDVTVSEALARAPEMETDDEARRMLRSLGYLGDD